MSAIVSPAATAETPAAVETTKEKPKKEKKAKPEKGGGGDAAEEEKAVDVSRLNMRIGKIVEVCDHVG